jgi:hypothetical protein
MSLILYTSKVLKMDEIKFIPNETIYITKKNIHLLPLNVKTLPVVVKKIAGKEEIIEGEKVYEIEPLSIHDQVNDLQFNRN